MAIREIRYKGLNYSISYELIGEFDTSILFLHGWGSNKNIMKQAFSKLFYGYKHIYVDLLGHGRSSIEKPLNSFEYADIMKIFLKEIEVSPKAIVAHSFGGKIATLLNPEFLILLSSAGIIWPKRLSIRFKIAIFKFLKFFGGRKLYKLFASKDVSNMQPIMYETFKIVVDEDFSDVFSSYKKNALIFWGKDDEATPLKSAHRLRKIINPISFNVYDGDHFFFLKNANLIEKEVLLSLEGQKK